MNAFTLNAVTAVRAASSQANFNLFALAQKGALIGGEDDLKKEIEAVSGLKEKMIKIVKAELKLEQFKKDHNIPENQNANDLSKDIRPEYEKLCDEVLSSFEDVASFFGEEPTDVTNTDQVQKYVRGLMYATMASQAAEIAMGSDLKSGDEEDMQKAKALYNIIKSELN